MEEWRVWRRRGNRTPAWGSGQVTAEGPLRPSCPREPGRAGLRCGTRRAADRRLAGGTGRTWEGQGEAWGARPRPRPSLRPEGTAATLALRFTQWAAPGSQERGGHGEVTLCPSVLHYGVHGGQGRPGREVHDAQCRPHAGSGHTCWPNGRAAVALNSHPH